VEAGAGAQLAGDAAALMVDDAALGEGGLGPGGVGQSAGQALEEEIVDDALAPGVELAGRVEGGRQPAQGSFSRGMPRATNDSNKAGSSLA
jgi:hypothetical protein